MKKTSILWMLTLLLAGLTVTTSWAEESGKDQQPLNVLLVGNSQCPTIVKDQLIEKLAASDQGGRPIKITGCVKGGASLKSHWEAGTGAGSARGMIAEGPWDFIVLQEIYTFPEAEFQTYAPKFHELIKPTGAEMVLFCTASILSEYPKGFERLHSGQLAMAKKLGVPIVDASAAYFRYFGEKPSDELKKSLFAQDLAHPGLQGSYIYSCIIYSVVTGRSPVGLAAPEEISPEVAKALQETAWAQYQATAAALKE